MKPSGVSRVRKISRFCLGIRVAKKADAHGKKVGLKYGGWFETKKRDRIDKNYSLEGLNIKGDITAVLAKLEKFDAHLRNSRQHEMVNMNLLFCGPPGCGKSELARYIGERLDREIICKRVSDIQSKSASGGF